MLDVVELTQELVKIESVNPPGNEEACAKWLCDYLSCAGFETTLLPFGEQRFNLIAELRGTKEGPLLGFSGHLDTVPFGSAEWEMPPLLAGIREGRLYGRGSTDMKSGIAAFVSACVSKMSELKNTAGVRLILTGGEETGCEGARALRINHPSYLEGLGAIIVGEPTRNYPFIGHKGALWMRGVSSGVTAHGAMPERGDNAVYKSINIINRLRKFTISQTHPLMGSVTMNLGRIGGGANVNSVPDKSFFELDVRTIPGLDHTELRASLSSIVETEAEVDFFVDVPVLENDLSDPWLEQVFKSCQKFHEETITPKVVPYFTDGGELLLNFDADSDYLRKKSAIPVVILGPGEPSVMHKTDEYCEIESLYLGKEVYEEVLTNWIEKNF